MPTTSENILIEGLLGLVSRQWSALGVSVHAGPKPRAVIDLEALLWCTLEVARYDPRLFDEVADWLNLNSDRINVPRLRRISSKEHDIRRQILSAVAKTFGAKSPPLGWRNIAKNTDSWAGPLLGATPLFLQPSGDPVPVPSHNDSRFESRGLIRGPFERRGQSAKPRLHERCALLLRAQSLFGSTARAYVWTALFTSGGGYQAFFAEQTGYGQQAGKALREFVDSGICHEERRQTAKWYQLTDRAAWQRLLDITGDIPPWPNWLKVFRGLVALCRAWTQCNQNGLSRYLLASELRRAFVGAKEDLQAGGVTVGCPSPDAYLADEFLPHLKRYLLELLRRLEGPQEPR